MKLFSLLFFIFSSNVFSIEILLEENKAESGTVGYIDVVKIFNIYSAPFKENFTKEIDERQKKIDELKIELDHYIAKKEKLETEYQIAKMLEEFYKNISSTSQIDTSTSQVMDVIDESTSTIDTVLTSSDSFEQAHSNSVSSSTQLSPQEEPYIMMPGVGKFPLSNYKFSVSSSTYEISKMIEQLDLLIAKLKDNISELKKKYDNELSKMAVKENEKIFKKIYEAIEEVSREERVSIVIDKKNILFGRKTVDLTDKVINKLREK